MSNDWVVRLVGILENALKDNGRLTFTMPTGNEVVAHVTDEIVDLIRNNQHRLLQVGVDTFKTFLEYKSDGRDLEALEILYSKIETDELVEMAKINAIEMSAHAKKIQEVRKFWIDFAKKVGARVALGILSAGLA